MSLRRLVAVVALAAALVVSAMVPAGASTVATAPVLAADAYKWFYWIGFVLVLSLIGLLFMIAIGYYLKVLRPKWRGRQSA